MGANPVAVLNVGLVTAVGIDAPSSCAAIRAKVTNPSETRFVDSGGEWIMAHRVPLAHPWSGLTRLAKMGAMAIEQALSAVPRSEWTNIPVLLCVAEPERPGRVHGLDARLLQGIQRELAAQFAPSSAVIAHGRVSVAAALAHSRVLIHDRGVSRVLIAATDTLLPWPTLSRYESGGRLLTSQNSNGFMPGEGGGALLIGRPCSGAALVCSGIGFGVERAHIDSEEPLRGDGLTQAMKAALADAGCEMHDMDFRIADLSGEQYYFKEASIGLSRTLRRVKDEFDLWHPAESTGETGALVGIILLATAEAALRKGYANGPAIMAHMSDDSGKRAALTLHAQGVS